MRAVIFAVLLGITATPALARWKIRDYDPFNRNSGVRQTARNADPTQRLREVRQRVLHRVSTVVAANGAFRAKADEEGWTTDNCRVAGASLAAMVAGFQGAAICASAVAGEPLSTAGCTALIVSSGTAITAMACTQLCNDKKLRDCT